MARGRDADASRKRQERDRSRVIEIPPPADPVRRRELLAGPAEEWLRHYFGSGCGVADPFSRPFVDTQRVMIEAFEKAIREPGLDQAVAAPRGDGKTLIAQRLVIRAILSGECKFILLLQAAGDLAAAALDEIAAALSGENPLLTEDFPEVCVPCTALGGVPQRARGMIASGVNTQTGEAYSEEPIGFAWKADELRMPNVPGSPSAGSMIATRGLDSAVRGFRRKGVGRPDLVVCDDPETSEGAKSPSQRHTLEGRIEQDLGGLGSQERPVSRLILTTVQQPESVSDRYVDRAIKPSWNGLRLKAMVEPPTDAEMWATFREMKQEDWRNGADLAHAYYLENREQMDAGAVMSNPYRYVPGRGEVSALEHYMVEWARRGELAMLCEYQNTPPEPEGFEGAQLTAAEVQRRLSGFERGVVPPGCNVLTLGVDCNKRRIDWVVLASSPGGANSYVIDYGVEDVLGTVVGSDEGVELAIKNALLSMADKLPAYCLERIAADGEVTTGEPLPIQVALVDSRYMGDAVRIACASINASPHTATQWFPLVGHGQSSGTVFNQFRLPQDTATTKPCDHCYFRHDSQGWTCHLDADHWKAHVHSRLLTDPDKHGSLELFGVVSDEELKLTRGRPPKAAVEHKPFAREVTAEQQVTELQNGKLVTQFRSLAGRRSNHKLDATAYAFCAASLCGVELMAVTPIAASPQPARGDKPAPSQSATRQPSQPQRSQRRRGNLIAGGRTIRRHW